MQLILIVAVLIAPAYSATYAIKETWSSSGCSGTRTKFGYEQGSGLEMGSCNKKSAITAADADADRWSKLTCADNTVNGYTQGEYTDSACTVAFDSEDAVSTATTGTCIQGEGAWIKVSCPSTSEQVGALAYTKHSAAGCADSDLEDIGFWLINYCINEGPDDNGAAASEKWVVADSKFQLYKYASSDCSGTATLAEETPVPLSEGACQAAGDAWFLVGTMTGGASIAGYTAPADDSGNTATSAAISVFLGVLCTMLNLMFC